MSSRPSVLLTDYAWPDLAIEAQIIERAGFRLVSGPPEPSSADAIAALAAEHQPAAIMTNWAPVSAMAIAASPSLLVVARLGVGLDNIAVAEATRRGIWVTNVPDYCTEEVSDHAVAMLHQVGGIPIRPVLIVDAVQLALLVHPMRRAGLRKQARDR